jgi:hypothetical protein
MAVRPPLSACAPRLAPLQASAARLAYARLHHRRARLVLPVKTKNGEQKHSAPFFYACSSCNAGAKSLGGADEVFVRALTLSAEGDGRRRGGFADERM